MKRACLRCLLLAVYLMSAAQSASAVEVKPPLLDMSDPSLVVIAGDITEVIPDPPSIRMAVRDVLRGSADDSVQLLVDPPLLSRITPGQGYLALYSDLSPAPMKPRKLIRTPATARLVSFEGVEVSLFRDEDRWRKLLSANPIEAAQSADYRQRIFDGLSSADPQWSDLWAGELALRAQRLSPFSRRERSTIEALVRNPAASGWARARLLLAAHDRQPLYGKDWYVDAAAGVLTQTPVAAAQSAAEQHLVYAALTIAQAHPKSVPASVLESWLTAPPVLAEVAALALRAHSSDAELEAIDRVLTRALLPSATRNFLQQHRQMRSTQLATTVRGQE